MAKPKFRLFAGPNASGKTHVFKKFRRKKYIRTAFYVNADRYEEQIKKNHSFSFNAYRVKVDEGEFKSFILASGLFHTKDLRIVSHHYS
jgi:predicted ABC-type ATPase